MITICFSGTNEGIRFNHRVQFDGLENEIKIYLKAGYILLKQQNVNDIVFWIERDEDAQE